MHSWNYPLSTSLAIRRFEHDPPIDRAVGPDEEAFPLVRPNNGPALGKPPTLLAPWHAGVFGLLALFLGLALGRLFC